MIFYHVTLEEHLPSILEHGLIPSIGPRSQILAEQEPAIYAFPSREMLEDAMIGWAGVAFDEEEGALVILEVETDVIPEQSALDWELIFCHPIAATSIIRVFDEMWEDITDLASFCDAGTASRSITSPA